MKKPCLPALLVCFLFLACPHASAQPALRIQLQERQNIQISWPTTTDFALEQSLALGSAANWQTVVATPVLQNDRLTVKLPVSSAAQFFRLRQGAAVLTSITATSPVDGETGVAVTRETIVHFSGTLAANTIIKTNNFYATAAGRKILSRTELSSDRTKATLFYLEPLPGSARVNVFFDAEGLTDAQGQPLDPAGTDQPNGLKVFSFETLSLTPLTGTAVIGRVFASELVPGPDTGTGAVNKPLAGVTITVDGMEQTTRAVTDAQGNFILNNTPAGRFFVHIDGRTVVDAAGGIHYPDKTYYPFVGKAWDAVAGRTNNLAGGTGEIFLPLITPGTLQPVSMTQDTQISFPVSVVAANPALAGVTITVPANALFSDDGTRGGKVGIAPVPPDRLPGPLPPGLELPIVITVQTDGPLNFDKPAPICFPNLPDPVLKTPLPAGSKQALISFNHKKGIWEAVGSMTVSADGKFICADPGAGILQPGWHGVGPNPDGPPEPPDDPCRFFRLTRDQAGVIHDCPENCAREMADCLESAINNFQLDMDLCLPVFPEKKCTFEGDPIPCPPKQDVAACQIRAAQRLDQAREICRLKYTICLAKCTICKVLPTSTTLGGIGQGSKSQLRALADPDSVADQLRIILEKAADLIRPLGLDSSDVPADIQDQISALLGQANVVAGGDSGALLRSRVVAHEEEMAAYARSLGLEPEDLNPGNAPAYPVLYAATVFRPTGLFKLRGETGPFGQYSLFIPRDGKLLSVSFYDPKTRQFGLIAPNLSRNARFRLPRFTLASLDANEPDFDRDGLPDAVEDVYGTDPTKADSDGDGIPDGTEIDQGTNPLDGQAVRTGIVGTAKTPGAAVDVAAGNDLLAVAEGTSGVSIFNVFNGLNPVLIAHVPVPGNAQRVALEGNWVAVAAGDAGVEIIDASTPATTAIVHSFPQPGAQAVTANGGVAYAGFSSGLIVALDLKTGLVLDRLSVTNAVWDVALSGDYLYALTDDRLFAISPVPGKFRVAGWTNAPVLVTPNRRLFVGGAVAYTVRGGGYNTFDLTDPVRPLLLTSGNSTQIGWKHIVVNGSGTGVAAIGLTPPSPGDVLLYDVSDPRKNEVFLTQFVTPGDASAISIFNGLAYAADGDAGIQVVNYLGFDRNAKAPSLSLTTSAIGRRAEAGTTLRMTANATDDVQVRNVEFYLDGVKTFSDGNFPFEYRFEVPPSSPVKTNITLRARAIDTGGNFTWSEELNIQLDHDVTPPRVLASTPIGGGKVVSSLSAYFSEPMDAATLNTASFKLFAAGADGQFETVDDVPVSGGAVAYDAASRSAILSFGTPLPDGLYRAVITTAAADVTGNPLRAEYSWEFRVADAVFWTRSTDGSWDDPSAWSTGAAPGPADDVFIESIPGDVTITIGSGTRSFKSLVVGGRVVVNGATLKGGRIQQNAEGKLIFAGNSANTLDGITLIGDLELPSLAFLVIRNGLTLSGNVILNSSSQITFAGDQIFDNAQVLFASFATLAIQAGSTLTLGPNMIVRGKSGEIGGDFGRGKLINQGLILADGAGPTGPLTLSPAQFENAGRLECKNGGVIDVSIAPFARGEWRNTGQINATSGATFTLNGTWHNLGTINANNATVNLGGTFILGDVGTLNRSGGTINLTGVLDLGGGTLTLDAATGPWRMNSGTLKNGTLKQSGQAKLLFPTNGRNTLDAMRVEGDLDLTTGFATALIRNGLTLAGTALLDKTGAITFDGDQTFNSGQVVFAGLSNLGIEPGTTLTLAPSVIIRGKDGIIGNGVFSSSGTRKLINQGLIAADVPDGTLTISPTAFENPGTLRADGAGASVVVRVTGFSNTGKIEELNGGKVLINP